MALLGVGIPKGARGGLLGTGWWEGVETLTRGLHAPAFRVSWEMPGASPLRSPSLTHTLGARLNDGPAGCGAQHPRTGQSGVHRPGGGEIIFGQ
jgi:hypothetical protein